MGNENKKQYIERYELGQKATNGNVIHIASQHIHKQLVSVCASWYLAYFKCASMKTASDGAESVWKKSGRDREQEENGCNNK